MSTELYTDTEDRCILASIAYLGRNDFTQIRQVSHHLIKAKDGGREVYVWVDVAATPDLTGRPLFSIPAELFRIAAIDKARVDVISVHATAERQATLRHMMNATSDE